MKKTIKTNVKNGLKSAGSPVFIIFVVLALALWYINKLGHTYTTTVTIPVSIESNSWNEVGVVGATQNIECHIRGTGYRLMAYKMSPQRHTVKIDVGKLDIHPIEGSVASEVTTVSMFNAMSASVNDINILSISTPRIEIIAAPLKSKKFPVIPRIEVSLRDRFMLRERITTIPDSVEVRSVSTVIDTMKGIYTERLTFSDVHDNMTGIVPLAQIPDLVTSFTGVEYRISAEEYTEMSLRLSVSVKGYPEHLTPIVIPLEVEVRLNVFRSNYDNALRNMLRAYIDYADKATNLDGNRYKVYLEAEEGVTVREISPAYVELFFESRQPAP